MTDPTTTAHGTGSRPAESEPDVAERLATVEETLQGLVTSVEAFINLGVARVDARIDALLIEIKAAQGLTLPQHKPVRHLRQVSDGP